MTTLFAVTMVTGRLVAGDDLMEAQWMDLHLTVENKILIEEHRALGEMLAAHLQKEQSCTTT